MVVALRLPVQAYAYEKPLLADVAPALWRAYGLLPTRIGTHCVIKKRRRRPVWPVPPLAVAED